MWFWGKGQNIHAFVYVSSLRKENPDEPERLLSMDSELLLRDRG